MRRVVALAILLGLAACGPVAGPRAANVAADASPPAAPASFPPDRGPAAGLATEPAPAPSAPAPSLPPAPAVEPSAAPSAAAPAAAAGRVQLFSGLRPGTHPVHLHSICDGGQAFHLATLTSVAVGAAGTGAVTIPAGDGGRGWCVIVYADATLRSVSAYREV